ncbi:MAG: MarR family winged helix-turn-helix transcriptional regulator [Shimia sp.]
MRRPSDDAPTFPTEGPRADTAGREGPDDASARDPFDRARRAPEVGETIAFRLLVAVNHLTRPFHAQFGREAGVTITEWRCVLALVVEPGQSGGEVAERMGLDRMTVSRTLRALEARGLVLRRPDAANRRRSRWCLTEAGWAIPDAILPRAQAHDAALFGHVGPEDRAALERILVHLGVP